MIQPRTDREQLIAEVADLNGFERGVIFSHQLLISAIQDLKQRGLKALEVLEKKEVSK
jgi:hypothetical protein